MSLSVEIKVDWPGFALDAAFEAPAGVTALFGPSGAGKTTIARAVAGLLRPDAGRIALGDTVLFDGAINLAPHMRGVAYVFQEPRLFPHMSVAENIAFGGKPDGDLIELLGIGDLMERRPRTLSGGEAQRVGIARAMASAPGIVVMDEPLSALDAPRRAEILPWLERLRDARRVPILYVSHAMDEIARLADRLVVLEDGAVRAEGPLDEVLSDPTLLPLIGPRASGSVLSGKVTEVNRADGLSRISTAAGPLWLSGQPGPLGSQVRLRIPAADVILATSKPQGISALNVIEVQVTGLEPGSSGGVAVGLQAGTGRLLAHITHRSASALALAPGAPLFAIIKATAVS